MIAPDGNWHWRSACGEGVSRFDLQFRKVALERRSLLGIPYIKWVEVGMPSIPLAILDCVFYLYANKQDAEAGVRSGGVGFFVGVKSTTNPNAMHIYAISNWHLAVRDGFSVVRLNTQDGRTDVIELDASDWHFIKKGGDAAIAGFQINFEHHKVNYIGLGRYQGGDGSEVTQEEDANGFIGTGDDVFMVGRFIDHDGGQHNQPAVRFGNISIRPSQIEMPNSNKSVGYYCLDMHSRTGFSGSPVFAYRTAGSDLAEAFTNSLALRSTVLRFIGIHCGQFDEEMQLTVGANKGLVTGRSGMTIALPAWHICELLNIPLLLENRLKVDARWSTGGKPCPE